MSAFKKSFILFKGRAKQTLSGLWLNPLPNSLLRFSQYITIAGVFITIYFAWLTVNLTRKYGESKDQINRLDTIVNKQQASIDTLVDILKELRTQNGYAKEQTTELKSQGVVIFEQTQSVSKQLGISQQEQKVSNRFNQLSRIADKNKFRNAVAEIRDLYGEFRIGVISIDSISNFKKINFLNSLNPIVANQLTNPYLLEDDTLEKIWIKFYPRISDCITTLNNFNFKSTTVFEENKSFTPDSTYMEKYKRQGFNLFMDNFGRFNFSTNMKLMKDKELLYQK